MRNICLILTILFSLVYTEMGELDCESEKRHPKTQQQQLCDEDELIQFLADTQIINPESIVALALSNLEPMCRNLRKHLKSLDHYLKKCRLQEDDTLYLSLIKGVNILREKLCSDSEFSRRFHHHYHCLHELRHDFESCNAPADWNEETDKHQICRDYKAMIDCYYIKAAKVCGIASAKAIKELMRAVVDGVIEIKCAGIGTNPYVKDPMPAAYLKYGRSIDLSDKAETVQIPSKVVMFLIFLILYMN